MTERRRVFYRSRSWTGAEIVTWFIPDPERAEGD